MIQLTIKLTLRCGHQTALSHINKCKYLYKLLKYTKSFSLIIRRPDGVKWQPRCGTVQVLTWELQTGRSSPTDACMKATTFSKCYRLSGQFGQPFYLDKVIFKVKPIVQRIEIRIMKVLYVMWSQGQVKNGFFIEAGADDFETDSNSLYFEVVYTLQQFF